MYARVIRIAYVGYCDFEYMTEFIYYLHLSVGVTFVVIEKELPVLKQRAPTWVKDVGDGSIDRSLDPSGDYTLSRQIKDLKNVRAYE